MIDNPSDLGNFMIADSQRFKIKSQGGLSEMPSRSGRAKDNAALRRAKLFPQSPCAHASPRVAGQLLDPDAHALGRSGVARKLAGEPLGLRVVVGIEDVRHGARAGENSVDRHSDPPDRSRAGSHRQQIDLVPATRGIAEGFGLQ